MTEFFDSARWGLIPAGRDAALYADGRYKVTPQQAKRFGQVRWITVLGGADAAADAGVLDFELGNAAYEGNALRDWAQARQAMNCRARIYCDRSDVARAQAQVGHLKNVCYWVATLDNRQWTAQELAASVEQYGVTLPLEMIWAVQWRGGMAAAYDTSILLGVW